MFTDYELKRIAHFVAVELSQNDDFKKFISESMSNVGRNAGIGWISLKNAASMLGISASLLYKIKDDDNGHPNFSYMKTGATKSSPVKFNPDTLMEEYERYISRKISRPSA